MIYLATPYSHPDPEVKQKRFEEAVRINALLCNAGRVAYSPIVHCHPMAIMFGLPGDFAYWNKFNRDMIGRCEEFWVIRMEGWNESKGIKGEIEFADQMAITVKYVNPEDVERECQS